ncbi:DNA glycosylase AlkZ-like family protein [Mangrovihabitans endophyticus]|uniref:Winged helix DNA-binding domain-containing protein n=1 Tax=Mangrovihabitans endophyticus TaxID=1751298 RepID=A0A8J3FMK2_9ACTN|nr:crosslink repair DNA glycosylase YcaQ family protein [Mangrovihabitans endophyticus]GGK76668.1 hypothetical protein GCM10012284_08330 [Mangrovihabitans endophyticus]
MASDVTEEKLRAWWAHRQGLDGGLTGSSAADVLARTGWSRSVGGCTPYLGLFARGGVAREAADADVAALRIHELPSARGCTYVLPRQDFALGLVVGGEAPRGDIAAAGRHLGVTPAEIDGLCARVLAALEAADGPMDPADLRRACGDAVRSLGAEGKKRGQSTTLPMALGLLQARGEIRRVSINGRLDQQRFSYVRWSPSPLSGNDLDLETARTELARRYFTWAGPASLRHFRWFSGLTAAAARTAVAPLDLAPVRGTDLLLLPGDVATFESFTVPRRPQYALVAGIDGIHLLHREMNRLFDPDDLRRPEPGGKPGRTLGDESDPQCPIIVDRGRIVGLWEYDIDATEIVYWSFVSPDAAMKEAVARTEEFVREQLGDARTSILDSPQSRAPRIADLRAATHG